MRWVLSALGAMSLGVMTYLVLEMTANEFKTMWMDQIAVGHLFFILLCMSHLAAAGMVVLFAWQRQRRADRECRCRNCHQILLGLLEPRCPECGERL